MIERPCRKPPPDPARGLPFPADTFVRMKDRTLFWAALIMLSGVALGAFGAHGLKGRIGPDALDQWNKGVHYQFVHGLALLGLSALAGRLQERPLRLARALFLAGVVAFSGSLYLLSTRTLLGTDGLTPLLGPLTPIGGVSFMAGWIVVLAQALRRT